MPSVYMSSVTYMGHRKNPQERDCFKNNFVSTLKFTNQIYTYEKEIKISIIGSYRTKKEIYLKQRFLWPVLRLERFLKFETFIELFF